MAAEVRQQLAAAQSEACEAQRARGVMVAQLEQAAARERQWHEAYQALQSELHSLRAWMHSPAASGGGRAVHPLALTIREHGGTGLRRPPKLCRRWKYSIKR